MDKNGLAIILVAAGSSSRLGQAKQLLEYKGKTLIEHTIEQCIDSQLGDVYVVIGAHKEKVEPLIEDLNCQIVFNSAYEQGIGTSIAAGVETAMKLDASGVVICLVDQVYMSAEVLINLVEKQKSTKAAIVFSKYQNGQGPPTYFSSELFSELIELDDDDGAKSIVKKYMDQVSFIDFKLGNVDIDRPEDLGLLEV